MLRAALATAALAFTALPLGAAHAAKLPAGKFYRINVSTSFEPSFSDCWAFSSNGRFIVSTNGLGSFPYQLDELNTQAGNWQAVWRGHLSIGFSGVATSSSITGDGVDTQYRTYSFTGSAVSSCSNTVTTPGHGFQTR